jgi:WhiB family redox-sensing transcriptional regulator
LPGDLPIDKVAHILKGALVATHRSGGDWQARAACRGPEREAFYPPTQFEPKRERDQREAKAKLVCGTCDVRQHCLDYAIAINETQGVWGGLNEAERRQYAAQLRRTTATTTN